MNHLHLWPELLRAQLWAGDASALTALADDVDTLLAACGREVTREHIPRVTADARRLAGHSGIPLTAAAQSALLHDLGGIVPRVRRKGRCRCCTRG